MVAKIAGSNLDATVDYRANTNVDPASDASTEEEENC